MELKTDTYFRGSDILHYIQHDFIRQRPGLSKEKTSMLKSLVIN